MSVGDRPMATKEVTHVTEYDGQGRIKTFEKVIVKVPEPPKVEDSVRAKIRAAMDAGEPVQQEAMRDVIAQDSLEVFQLILAKTRAKKTSSASLEEAVYQLTAYQTLISIRNVEQRNALAARVTELERKLAHIPAGARLRVVGGKSK